MRNFAHFLRARSLGSRSRFSSRSPELCSASVTRMRLFACSVAVSAGAESVRERRKRLLGPFSAEIEGFLSGSMLERSRCTQTCCSRLGVHATARGNVCLLLVLPLLSLVTDYALHVRSHEEAKARLRESGFRWRHFSLGWGPHGGVPPE